MCNHKVEDDKLSIQNKNDIAASFQVAAVKALTRNVKRALELVRC